ncbi:MAG TPA: proline--tRNA ligase [Anaerolineales bacterium]|nr:proline--tRNA ligase [Anaerolineales bacterium]
MKISQLISQTLREAPADAEITSHKLLLRGGFISRLGAGIYSLLPLGQRVARKIETLLRDEMDAIGGQEVSMPVVQPADLWKETRRWYAIGDELGRLTDKNGRDMVLALTHEEVLTDIVRREVQSYKQLPLLVYHLQTKWRDDPRPRAGLIRVREFVMKDSYSIDRDWEGLEKQYRAHYQAYFNIFNRCALPSIAVKADVGMMGGKLAHEFMYLTPIGEDTLILCDACGYVANRQVAEFRKPEPDAEEPAALEKIATPGCSTIAELAQFLGVPAARTAKAVFLVGTFAEGTEKNERVVFAVVRGDMELNETKLTNAIGAVELRSAHDEEIRAAGAEPGYASAIGIDPAGIVVVVDDLVARTPNLVAGANETGFHYKNTNYGRDYDAGIVADIVSAAEGHACPDCGEPLRASRGVEVGNIFQLGTRYSADMNALFQDEHGEMHPVIMGSYGIGVGRLLACIAEHHNDEDGLIWPITVAPYQVHLVVLTGAEYASGVIYDQLREAGIEVLYDDRDESPGVKFKDADLIGVPLRITVGKRGLQTGDVELKRRSETEKRLVPVDGVVEAVRAEIEAMEKEVLAGVVIVPYRV